MSGEMKEEVVGYFYLFILLFFLLGYTTYPYKKKL